MKDLILTHVEGDVTICEVLPKALLSSRESYELQSRLYDIADSCPAKLLVDLSNVTILSSWVLGAIVEVQRRVRRGGGSFKICATHSGIQKVLGLLGDGFVEIHSNLPNALQSFEKAHPPPSASFSRKALVLLADGDPAARERLRNALRAEGMFMLAANDRLVFEQHIRDQRPDAVVVAMRFDGLTGLQITKALKRKRRLSSIPVIVLAHSASEEDRLRALSLGACAYFVKEGRYELALTFYLKTQLRSLKMGTE